jgi:hypothetical protein
MTKELLQELLVHVGKATAELLQAAALAPQGTQTKTLLVSLWQASHDRYSDLENALLEMRSKA